jgi:hypothetical protein
MHILPLIENSYLIPIITIIAVNVAVLTAIFSQGFTVKAFTIITTLASFMIVLMVAILIVYVVLFFIPNIIGKVDNNVELLSYTIIFLLFFVVLIAFIAILTAVFAGIVVFAAANAAVAKIAVGFPLFFIESVLFFGMVTNSLPVAFFPLWLTLMVGSHIAKQALEGNKDFATVRTFAINLATIGGTNFFVADLIRVNFSNTVLGNTNFRGANLTQVYWKNAQNIERSVLGNSYLQNPQIRQLVTALEGQDQNFDRLDMRGINLQGGWDKSRQKRTNLLKTNGIVATILSIVAKNRT